MKRGGLGWVEFSVGFSAWLLGACGDDTATATIATESSTSASTGAAAGSTTGTPTTGPDVTSEPSTGISDAGSASSSTSGEPTTEPTTEPLTSTSTGDTTTDTTTDTTGAPPVCGDGEVDPDEECDQGPGNSDEGSCTLGCKNAICGDGLLGPGEACDDANQVDEDSCTNACALATCGDGKLQGDEQCDDNNTDDSDACLNTCLIAACGDGVVQAGVEECDDGNDDDSDDCSACKQATCEDGVQNGGESDLDCGGMTCPKCGIGLTCSGASDCGPGVLCQQNKCAYARNCKALKDALPEAPSGIYTVDLDGEGPDPEQSVYCDQTTMGGGWTRIMSAKYPFFYNNASWQNYNAGQPEQDNYSILSKRDLFKDGITYTFRYVVGNAQTFKDGPIVFQVAWQQGHDPFGAATSGVDYQFLAGDKPTTCGGFNGLHNKYTSPSYTTDVDLNDGSNCWWMQVVPRDDWNKYGYSPGYLHGFLGGINNPAGVTQWEVLYAR